ncbi:MAG: hypothetical protein COA45_06365 [Zetaproteobacteria bacterium]|nr:MAG: hypothetical protein COA45_06365 [Zetaproteobacteria bacterium]
METLDWIIFFSLVPILLFIDLKLFNKGENKVIGFRQSIILSAWYIAAALAFGLLVWHHYGADRAMNYYTAYVIEKSLSLDNLFVMSVIFSAFSIPREYQHRVLVWGIIGVIFLRGIMISSGAALVHNFDWVLYVFAAILIFTGIRMLFMDDGDNLDHFEEKPLVVFLKKHFAFTPKIHGNKFIVPKSECLDEEKKGSKSAFIATPLLLALIVIEISDVIFAVDSIPAALSVTTDVFVVFTSNIFAVLGLRALFFAVEHVIERFELMKYALSAVLIFIGGKVFYNGMFGHISPAVSLTVTLSVLTAGVVFSLIKTRGDGTGTDENQT